MVFQKLVKIIFCSGIVPDETWLVLPPATSFGRAILPLLPTSMEADTNRFVDWNGLEFKGIKSLSNMNIPGGIWFFIGSTNTLNIPLSKWWRAKKAKINAEKLSIQFSSPEISHVHAIQKIKIDKNINSFCWHQNLLYLLTDTLIVMVDAFKPDAKTSYAHQFNCPNSFVAKDGQFVVVDADGKIGIFKPSAGTRECFNPVHSDLVAETKWESVFSARNGFILKKKGDNELFLIQMGQAERIFYNNQLPTVSSIHQVFENKYGYYFAAGNKLFHVIGKGGEIEWLYESETGHKLEFTGTDDYLAVIDNQKIVFIHPTRPFYEIASFFSNGFGAGFAGPIGISAEGNNLLVLDSECICRYRIILEPDDITKGKKEYQHLYFFPHVPETPFIPKDKILQVAQGILEQNLPVEKKRDLFIEFAKSQRLLEDISGQTVLMECFALLGLNSFLGKIGDSFSVFIRDSQNLCRILDTYEMVQHAMDVEPISFGALWDMFA